MPAFPAFSTGAGCVELLIGAELLATEAEAVAAGNVTGGTGAVVAAAGFPGPLFNGASSCKKKKCFRLLFGKARLLIYKLLLPHAVYRTKKDVANYQFPKLAYENTAISHSNTNDKTRSSWFSPPIVKTPSPEEIPEKREGTLYFNVFKCEHKTRQDKTTEKLVCLYYLQKFYLEICQPPSTCFIPGCSVSNESLSLVRRD